MTVAPVAYVVAGAAGLVTSLIAFRGLSGGRRGAAVGAAVARGMAVALATFAAFAPVAKTTKRVPGETLIAAPNGADVGPANLTLRWPADAPDAASAVETLRASRDAHSPASLALATGGDIGRGRDVGPAALAMRRDASVDPFVLPLPSKAAPPTPKPAPRILAPAGATEGVPVQLTIDAGDEPFAAGEARVEIDGRATTVPLVPGAKRVTTPPLALAAGTHLVVVEAPGRLPAASIVDVAGPPRVVFVSADGGTRDVVEMLRTQGLDVADIRASDLHADDVDRCAAIVLGPGVSGGPLADAVAARIRAGSGLLVVGGDGAQGLSRFRGTPLEALLPVVPPPPPKPPPAPPVPPPPVKKPDPAKPKSSLDEGDKVALRVALLLVIDTSGSMAASSKLQMAQQSAIAAAEALSSADRVAVISFDDDAHEVAPFQDAVEMETLFQRIAGLRATGETNFFPALKVGYREILKQPCGIRHVLLLTDGETRPAVFRDLIEDGAAQGVTLSTIGIGDDADTNLLALLAGWGKGKLYVAKDPARLPAVVTLDTRRFTTDPRDEEKRRRQKLDAEDLPEPPSNAPPVDRPTPPPTEPEPPREVTTARRPHVASAAALLAGLADAPWPAIPFAETTRARPAAQVVLAWDDSSPALTLGRAGLGRVAAVSAGVASIEARDFRQWPPAPQFLAQLVRALVEPAATGAGPIEAKIIESDDGRAFVRVDVAGGGALGLDPLRAGASLDLRCADRGAFSLAELPAMPPAGVYVGVFAPTGGLSRRVTAVSAGPRGPSADVPAQIARASGATIVDRVPAPRDGKPERRDTPAELPLLLGAAGLLVVEAALRRVARIAA